MNRLSGTPWKIFIRASMVCAGIGAIVFGLSLRKIEPLPLSQGELKFEGKRAHQWMTDLSKKFPNRVTWRDERRAATRWLKEEFRKMGYEPKGMQFSETIEGKVYTDLENVYVEKRGTRNPDEIILAAAHYDITDTTVEGAMDDASGVGVVLELARVFANEKSDRTMIFLLTDSEEFGAFWGARAFAKQFDRTSKIVAAANFDFLAPEKQVSILTLCDGLKQGFTPLWLRELALNSLRSIGGFQVPDLTHFVEFTERAILVPPADHGAFLQAGVPSFNWVGQNENFTHEMAHYHHTHADVAEALLPQSFSDYGRAAERLFRSIDGLLKIPDDFRESNYWKLSGRYYLEGWGSFLLHILAFVPFLAYCIARFGSALKHVEPGELAAVLKNEGKNAGILLGSILVGYVVILLLPALRIITQYETFPATQKSVILYNPNFLVMALVVACIAFVYMIFSRTFRHDTDRAHHPEIRHAFHSLALALIIVIGLAKNSYLTTLLLLPPAYFWMAVRSRKTTEDRIMNSLLLLGGSITLIGLAIAVSSIFHVGAMYWYAFLSASYGLISAYTVILFSIALTIMIRMFRSFVL